MKKRTQALVIVLSTVLGLFPGMPAYSNPEGDSEGDSEAGGIVAVALEEARRQGLLDFAFHSGSNQCRSLSRFNRTRAVLERAQTGNAVALRELDEFINASSMQNNCVRSITSGNFGALVDRLAEIDTTEYTNDRTPAGSSSCGRHVGRANNLGLEVRSPSVLTEGSYLQSTNGRYRAVVQGDGNFVVYDGNRAIWASNSPCERRSEFKLQVQNDGNVVMYDGNNNATWASNTAGDNGSYILIMQDDGNLVLYNIQSNGHRVPIWASM